MLSTFTMALAMFAVTADGTGKPSAFRLSDYVRHGETPAAASSQAPGAPRAALARSPRPVRVAQAPVVGFSDTPAPSYARPPLPYEGAVGGEVVMDGPVTFGDVHHGEIMDGVVSHGPVWTEGPVHGVHGGYGRVKRWGFWGLHGLPTPWCPPADFHQHIPYLAHPKSYYYFRPYQWFHIPDQQSEVLSYGGDPRHPYANRVFDEVYEEFETPPVLPVEIDGNQ